MCIYDPNTESNDKDLSIKLSLMRSEKKKKNLKKIYGGKSQSVNHLTNLDDLPTSSISLNNLQTFQYNNNTTNNNDHHTTDNQSFIDHSNSSPQLPPVTSSISPLSNYVNKNEIRSNNNNNRYIGGLNKHLSQSEHILNSKRSFHGIEYNIHELEERFDYYSMNHKTRIAEFEWKCLMERQELRRAYLLNLGELKQRRIMSLCNMNRLHIKTYYDIQKKWLCNIHSNELTQRNQISHETLKKLTESQIIERQTACKLLKQSIKGQKQMIQLLEDNLKRKDESLNKSEQTYTTDNTTTNNTTNKTTYKSRLFIEQLMESPYFIQEDYSSEDMIGIQKNRLIPLYSPSSITSINGSSNNLHQQNDIINRAKSTQSIHSTISAYESLSKTVLNIITNRQNDLWTSILEQEQLLTENLLKAQLEQLKLLITSENAALKRCQIDYDNRIAYLSVTLEATQKFAEHEFAEEQERLIQFYFPNSDMNNLRSASGYPSETFQRDYSLHELNNDNTQLLKNNTDNIENSPENIRPVSSSIRKFEKYTNEHGQKIIPITFKTPSSSKFNSINIQREMLLRQDTN
uniref:Centrosomal protein of 135 kDa n=1 Tax=Schistosoma haematobium TaxID=6185 RepID=A0A095C5R7_SCHHA